jgi:hypothetical protein
MTDPESSTTLSVYFATGGMAKLPIQEVEELPSILRNLRNAMVQGTVYSVHYNNLTWTVNGALVASYEVSYPWLRKMVEKWEKENPLPPKKKWWRFW